jgi:hypothetical protein
MVLMGYSGARGTLIYEKNLMSKISCQTPFKIKKCAVGIFESMFAEVHSKEPVIRNQIKEYGLGYWFFAEP